MLVGSDTLREKVREVAVSTFRDLPEAGTLDCFYVIVSDQDWGLKTYGARETYK